MKVPFVDLKKQYLNIKKEIDTSIQRNINNTSFIGGSDLDKFSNKLSSLLGKTRYPSSEWNGCYLHIFKDVGNWPWR